MTVKELKENLNKFPDNMQVFMSERKTEFAYGLLNSVRQKKINFVETEGEDSEIVATELVVILDEE